MEDYYTYYVVILHISEEIFWNCDISFVISVAENTQAYDGWLRGKEEEMYGEQK